MTDREKVRKDMIRNAEIVERLKKGKNSEELLDTEFPEIPWVIPGFVTTGLTLLAGPPKLGKALDGNTPIFTTHGWRTMSSLKVGEKVYSETGSVERVIAKITWKDRPCYEITFDCGDKIIADASHEWMTIAHIGGEALRETQSIAESVNVKDMIRKRDRTNHAIRLAAPLAGNTKNLPIAPYTLGAWLGDGTRRDGYLTCSEKDSGILRRIERDGYTIHGIKSSSLVFNISGLRKALRIIGIINKKRIPNIYLTSSYSQRLELLRGIMDTDGSCGKNGRCELTFCDKELSEDAITLCRGLGIKTHVQESAAKLNGREVGRRYRIGFTCALHVFHLERKLLRQGIPSRGMTDLHRIIKVSKSENRDTVCIQVSSPSGLFLVGKSLIPTHNSWMVMGMACALSTGGRVFGEIKVNECDVLLLALEDTERRLKDRLQKMWVRGSRRLHIRTQWPTGTEGVAYLDAWLTEYRDTKAVFIDTLQKVSGVEDSNSYRETYNSAAGLKKIADKHGIAIVAIHHTSKTVQGDFVHTVNGSVGLTGAADTVITMRRMRMSDDGVLSITGRDVEEREMGIHFDPGIGSWTLLDEVPKEKKPYKARKEKEDWKMSATGDG
jgi:hypothetical protein